MSGGRSRRLLPMPSGHRTATEPPEPELLSFPSGDLPVRWRRCGRARRVSLRIDPRIGAVVVTLPRRAAKAAGLALLNIHAGWAVGRLAALPQPVPFSDGASLFLHGQLHVIRHAPEGRRGVWAEAGKIHVSGEVDFLARRVGDFLRAQARDRMRTLVTHIATQEAADPSLLPKRLSIKDTSTRWGSCSSDKKVMFSWRLVMAPPEVQHYVVAHELAHLRHLDHGDDFWRLVDQLTPHRLPAEQWLKRCGPALLRTG